MSPDTALVVCRFLHAAALMLLWGGSAYLAWLVPGGLAQEVARPLSGPALAAIAVAVASGLASLPIETAQIGDGWTDAFDAGAFGSVLFDTAVGRAWQLQMAVVLLLLAPLLVTGGVRLTVLALASCLGLASLALSGHAVIEDGLEGVLHRANDAVHLLSGGAWLGALLPLFPILRRLRDQAWRREAVTALWRFSTAGHVAVAVVILTGLGNTWLTLGHLPTDWLSPYQGLLALKIAVVSVMTLLAVLNRYWLVPRLSRHPGALDVIRISTLVEIVLGLAAIACVAWFGTLEPV
jgi:copper resistance protein D